VISIKKIEKNYLWDSYDKNPIISKMDKPPNQIKYLSPLEILSDIDWACDDNDDIIPLRKSPVSRSVIPEKIRRSSLKEDSVPISIPETKNETADPIPNKKKVVTNVQSYGYKSKLSLLSKKEGEMTDDHKTKIEQIRQKELQLKQELEIKLASLSIKEKQIETAIVNEKKRIDSERKKISLEIKDKLCKNGVLVACVLRQSEETKKYYAEQIPYIEGVLTIDSISADTGLKIGDVVFSPYRPIEAIKNLSNDNKIDGYMLGGIVYHEGCGELYFMMLGS
jgi:hypothetical protein